MAGAGRVRLCQSLYIFVSPIDQTYTQLHVAHLRFTETYIQVRCVIYCLASALEKLHQPKTEHLCKLGWIMDNEQHCLCRKCCVQVFAQNTPGGLCTWGTELSWARLNEGLIGRQRTGTLQWPLWSCSWRRDVKVSIYTKALDGDLDLHDKKWKLVKVLFDNHQQNDVNWAEAWLGVICLRTQWTE